MANTAAQSAVTGNGTPADVGPEAPESLDQVRNILFGGQMRMVDSRLHDLEERFLQEQSALRAEFFRQLEEIDAAAKRELAAQAERLAAERQKRTDDLKSLGTELKEALKNLEKRHRKLEETAGLADAELRDQLLQTGNALSAELSRTADRISTELDRSASELRSVKVDKAALANALTEMATKLTSNGHAGTVTPQG